MPVVTASDFIRSFARFQDIAHHELVTVTSHGRVVGGYLSAQDLELFERLKRRDREVLVVGQLPDDVVADLNAAEYGVGPK